MAYSESCREKLTQTKIQGQSKPFVDQDLQLQLPGSELASHIVESSAHSPIYSHYASSCSTDPFLTASINEAELYHVMAEAESSFEAWKKMEQRIKQAAQNVK